MIEWDSILGFFRMGGYAWYVWGSYLVTILLVIFELGVLFTRMRYLLRANSR